MKNSLLTFCTAAFFLYGCSSNNEVQPELPNTENSILITGISESISYDFRSSNGRTSSSIPDDINMIQILILNSSDEIVYEQYHYNHNAYNYYYYDSAAHGGDDHTFENTIPDTLYIPPLADGTYTVLASTVYAEGYNYYEDTPSYPYIESYQLSDNPIFVGKATATVTQDSDELVVIDMKNISARIDLNITSTQSSEWSIETQLESTNGAYYTFSDENLNFRGSDHYDYAYMWTDAYYQITSFYFLPRDMSRINMYVYEYYTGINLNFESQIDPKLSMAVGDVLTLNIDIDEIIEGGGSATFNWEDIDWNDVGNLNIP